MPLKILPKGVLRLTITKKWFDLIASGVKTEEYRKIKPSWLLLEYTDYDTIVFRNGYRKSARTLAVECKGVVVGIGNVAWGAPPAPVYIIKLGKIVGRELRTKEIVKNYLVSMAYDGLFCDGCGCETDDLMPCGDLFGIQCMPGYKIGCNPDTCQADGNCKFHIGEKFVENEKNS